VLSGRGLCDELITRPEESYRLRCVVVCDLENLKNEEAMTRVGSQRHKKKKKASNQTIFSQEVRGSTLPVNIGTNPFILHGVKTQSIISWLHFVQ